MVIIGIGTDIPGETALAAHIAQIDNTADGGADKAHGRHGQTKAGSVGKAVGYFIGVTPRVSLTGTLTIAHGKQNAGGKEAVDGIVQNDGDSQTQNSLQQVGADHGDAAVKGTGFGTLIALLIYRTQGHGGKTKAETVVGQNFKGAGLIQFHIKAVLENGIYKVVSIADFIAGNANNPSTKFWNVTGINNINTLKVTAGECYGTWAWETLGAVVDEFEVSEQSSEIKVSVKPATALVQVVFDYFDVVNGDGNGVSMYAPFCSEVFIHSKTQYDMISDFNSPTFNYSSSASQKESYNIMYDSPMETVNDGYRRNIGYRALLPQDNKTFYWDITMIWPDGTSDELSSDYTPALDLKAGKQYELYLYLDALQLFFEEVGTTRSVGNKEVVSLNSASNNLQSKCSDFGPRTYKVLDIAKSDKLMK